MTETENSYLSRSPRFEDLFRVHKIIAGDEECICSWIGPRSFVVKISNTSLEIFTLMGGWLILKNTLDRSQCNIDFKELAHDIGFEYSFDRIMLLIFFLFSHLPPRWKEKFMGYITNLKSFVKINNG